MLPYKRVMRGWAMIMSIIIIGKLRNESDFVLLRTPSNNRSGSSCRAEKAGNVTSLTMEERPVTGTSSNFLACI